MHRKSTLDASEIETLIGEISDESLAQMIPVIVNKLKKSAGAASGSEEN
ncbi:MAG: hypothetical protein Q4C12_01685 [Clostridia bacterium]|nr:hypothetical protein [Clostridia bacterium]